MERPAPAGAPQHTGGPGSGLTQGVLWMLLPPVRTEAWSARPPSVAGSGTRDLTSKDSGPGTTLNAEALLVPLTTLFPPPALTL